MFRKILILAAVVAIHGAACAAPASTGTSTGPTNPERTAATTVGPTPAPSPFPDDDAFADLVRHVASGGAGGPALDALWQTVFERGSVPAAYRSPTAVIGYRAGEIPESAGEYRWLPAEEIHGYPLSVTGRKLAKLLTK